MIARRFFANGVSSAVILAIGALTGVITARALGAEDRGLLGIVFFWGQFLSAFCTLSLSDALVVLSRRFGDLRPLTAAAYRIAAALVVLSLPIGAAIIWIALHERDQAALTWALIFWVPQLAVLCVDQVAQGILRCQERYAALNVLRASMPAGYLAFALMVWALKPSVPGFVVAHIAALLLALAVRVWVTKPWRLWSAKPSGGKDLLAIAGRFQGIAVLSILSSQIDKLLVVTTESPARVGLYLVSLTVAGPLQGLMINAVKTITLPHLVREESARRSLLTLGMLRAAWLSALLSMAIVAVSAPILVPMLFGREFEPAGTLAVFLTVALAFQSVRSVLTEALKANNSSGPPMIGEVVYCLSFVAAYGAAWATHLNWPVAWGLGAANTLSAVYLAAAYRRFDSATTFRSWLLPPIAAIRQLAVAARTVMHRG